MMPSDSGNYIANIRTDPRWLAFSKYIESLISERQEVLSANLISSETDKSKANSLIGEIRAFREIVSLPRKLAEKGQKGIPSGE